MQANTPAYKCTQSNNSWNGVVTATAVNSSNTPVTLVSAVLSGGANPCTDISLSIEASEVLPTVRVNGNLVTESNASNPYITTFKRGIDFSLWLSKEGELQVALSYPAQYYLIVPTFGVNDINVQINASISGATVIVSVETIEHQRNVPLVFEYSLDDGTTWVSQNIFTGQTAGTYTIQVRDQFGCQHSQDYIVLPFSQREPFLFISKTNSKIKESTGYFRFMIIKDNQPIKYYKELTTAVFLYNDKKVYIFYDDHYDIWEADYYLVEIK